MVPNSDNNARIVKGKIREYQILAQKQKPRIVKTANTKPANNEGRLYSQTCANDHLSTTTTLNPAQAVLVLTLILINNYLTYNQRHPKSDTNYSK